jgi:hypothetical protein
VAGHVELAVAPNEVFSQVASGFRDFGAELSPALELQQFELLRNC